MRIVREKLGCVSSKGLSASNYAKKIKQCGENAVRPSGPTTQTECRDDGLREAFTSTLKSTDRPSKGEPDGQTESLYLPRVCPDSTRKCNARFPRLCKSETFYHVHVILAVEVSLFFLSFSFFFFFFLFVFIFDTVLRAVICLMLIRYDDVNNFLDSRFHSIDNSLDNNHIERFFHIDS